MEDLSYKLDQYEGPLDLLLTLIAKNKVNIIDISIAEICDQYIAYIEEARKMDLEIASEFITMASELMLLKSRTLLPKDEDDDSDPRAELIDTLLLYQKAKDAAKALKPLYEEYYGRMIKEEDEIPPEKGFPLGLDPALLSKALNNMLNRIRLSEQAPEKYISPLIKTKIVNVEKKIADVIETLNIQGSASLFFLLKSSESKSELLATFMGILELIKQQRILIASLNASEEEDEEEYREEEDWLTVKFELNPNYVPPEDENNEKSEITEESEQGEND
ncbi:MAG: hypothetical protein E7587_09350 [Ruminococcaceae bacterium]|nr:hypothetical protein [Oscillospiraceae bacterium]